MCNEPGALVLSNEQNAGESKRWTRHRVAAGYLEWRALRKARMFQLAEAACYPQIVMIVREQCPSCGGAGGGPFGPAGSAWDDEEYECPRCEGTGMIVLADPQSQRPGIIKAAEPEQAPAQRKATG